MLSCHYFVVEHRQLNKDRRDSYTKLLELECESDTCTPRHIFWLAREYIYKEAWQQARETCLRFLHLDGNWHVEAAHALRMLAKAEANLGDPDEALARHLESIRMAPAEREMWLDLARYHFGRKEYLQVLSAAVSGLKITKRPDHYLTHNDAWGFMLYEVAGICAATLELKSVAEKYFKEGVRIAPWAEDRLRTTAYRHQIEIPALLD